MNGPGSPWVGSSQRVVWGIAALVLCACALWPAGARAATVSVTTTSDTPGAGQCSLREAVLYATGTAEPGCGPGTATPPTTIQVPAGTYTLSGSGLSLTAGMTIAGAGAGRTTISGGHSVQPINVAAGALVAISGVTVTDGVSGVPSTGCTGTGVFQTCPAENGDNGGGIANAGSLTLTDDVIAGNVASDGTLPHGLFVACLNGNCPARRGDNGGGGGSGGGIYSTGRLDVEHSTISGNTAGSGASGTNGVSGTGTGASIGQDGGAGGDGGDGGGIANDGGTLIVNDSSVSGNRAGAGGNGGAGSDATDAYGDGGDAGYGGFGGYGGGIESIGLGATGAFTVTGSTLTGNRTGRGGNGAAGGHPTGGGRLGLTTPGFYGGAGGAIYSANHGSLMDDTLTANSAQAGGTPGAGVSSTYPGSGGGLAVYDGLVQMSFVTIAGNASAGTAGGVGVGTNGALVEAASIVADNIGSAPQNCRGDVTDAGHNLVFGDGTCPGTNADPRLGPLQDNGGPTATLALTAGSGAIGLVPANDCPVDTDQRGVTRPQGTRCDAGAYELAPPALTAPAASAGQSGAVITASIIPNLQPTRVVVRYGRTAGYGSATDARAIGSAAGAVAFRAPLSGLAHLRTYHAQVVATNGDGTTTSGDLTFTTGLAASIAAASTRGATLRLRIACRGGAAARCAGPITVTSRLARRAGRPVAVSARTAKRRLTRTVIVDARRRYAVAAGATRAVTVRLDRLARSLLRRLRRLPATVTVSGAAPPRRRVVFATHHRRRHR